MLLRIALKSIKKNLLMNVFIILELTAVVILSLVMASSFMIRYQYYEPFHAEFQKPGIYCEFPDGANKYALTGEPNGILSDNKLLSELDSAESVLACNIVISQSIDEKNNVTFFHNYSYSDEMITRYTPQITNGRFLNTSENTDIIEAVITERCDDLSVGDIVTIDFITTVAEVKIVGELADNAKIFGASTHHSGNDNFNVLYSSSNDNEHFPLMLFSSQAIDKYNESSTDGSIVQGMYSGIITFPEDTTDDVISDEQKKLRNYGVIPLFFSISSLNENSIVFLVNEICNLLPIILVALVISITSSISCMALTTYHHLREFAIYYTLGLRWRQCEYICLIKVCIISVVSTVISILLICIISFTSFSASITVIPGIYSYVAVIIVLSVFILSSMIIPISILKNNTPKQIFTR